MSIKKLALAMASAMLVTTLAFAARPAFAADKVDCDAVMNEVNSGKHAEGHRQGPEHDALSVRKCKKHAAAAAKASTKSSMQAQKGQEPPAAPSMAAPAASPAMAAPAAAASPK